MRALIRASLVRSFDATLVDELLDAYEEAKRNFYLGGFRLSAVEGGRFCEAAYRLLQHQAQGQFTPLGTQLNTAQIETTLQNLPATSQPDSVRLHIPRALRMVYDIRNKRDAAHLADGIDPNLQDATLVAGVLDWTMAELIRLHHDVSADEAQKIVDDLVTRSAPVIEDFDGFLKVLNPNLGASDYCLVLAYQRGAVGLTFDEISDFVQPTMRSNLRRTLNSLVNRRAMLHYDGTHYRITGAGRAEVEAQRLFETD